MFREGAQGVPRGFFDAWSRFYDAKAPQSLTYRPVHDAVCAEMSRSREPADIVDVGCGTGILAARLAGTYPDARITGVDLSPGMLAKARQRSRSVAWVEADAQHLPFENSSFDAVCCTESFHWYPDQHAALAEFRRVLRGDGALYLAFVNPATRAVEWTVNSLTRTAGRPAHWTTAEHLEQLLDAAGFAVQHRTKVRRWPPGITMPTYLTVAV